jgi:hypothetical protein
VPVDRRGCPRTGMPGQPGDLGDRNTRFGHDQDERVPQFPAAPSGPQCPPSYTARGCPDGRAGKGPARLLRLGVGFRSLPATSTPICCARPRKLPRVRRAVRRRRDTPGRQPHVRGPQVAALQRHRLPKLIVRVRFPSLAPPRRPVKRGLFGLCPDRSRGSGLLRFTPDSHLIRATD